MKHPLNVPVLELGILFSSVDAIPGKDKLFGVPCDFSFRPL